ncbi:MAG: outer membrane beta-barrel family protein [Bacteroidota bacterium]
MEKKLKTSISILLIMVNFGLVAQFGPGGGGPGGPGGWQGNRGGSENGRPKTNATTPNAELNLDGNVPKGNSKVTGYIINESVSKAVEYASVALYNSATKKPADGTMADEKGKFSMNKVAPGKYYLMISFIGFENKTIDSITVEKGKDVDLGVIKMKESVRQLDEVTVTAEKSLIEERVDRLVYNAEKDLTARGGDASDVLRKVPMLSVDFDGNVTLRGTSNIRVLINNKPSTIVASSIADALKMIPADLIKSVEVITSPSAKYDAEGTGGIINIITKKSNLQGINLNVDAGVGLRGSNLGLNGNIRKKKLGITLGGFGRAFYNKSEGVMEQTTTRNGVESITKQNSDSDDDGLFGRYNVGFDYDFTKNQSITGSVAFGTRSFKRDQNLQSDIYSGSVLKSTTLRDVVSTNSGNSVDFNLDYIRTFKPGQEWSVSAQISQNKLVNDFDSDIMNGSFDILSSQKNLNDSYNRELTLQTDYVTPIGQNQQFELGVKTVRRQVDSDFEYQIAGPSGVFTLDSRNPAGLLNYSQNISAGYLSYTLTTKNKITFKVGSRYESTTIDANNESKEIVISPYSNFVPSINISKKLKKGTLKLAYNNRIQRPGLQQLNPNYNTANPQSITIGNPNLKPEISNNFELSLSGGIKKSYLTVALFNRQTNNSITRISTPSDTLIGAIITTFQNIGKEQTTGINLNGNFFLTPKWTMNGGLDIYYNYLDGFQSGIGGTSEKVSNDGIVYGGRIQSSIQLNNGWGIQAFGGYRGNNVQLQGSNRNSGMYSIGVRKDFNNKKGSFGLATENFFGGMVRKSFLDTPILKQTSTDYIYNQNIKLTFSFKIGNMRLVEEKKSKVRNDDTKAGGDDN